MQTPATIFALPPVSNAAESITMQASSTQDAAATGTGITTGRSAIACGFLLLVLALLALAAITPAGHDVPDADTFINFP